MAELGQGGMATVFCAQDTELRRDVAVKVLFPHLGRDPQFAARFQREARAIAALDHPHILRVFDVGGEMGSREGEAAGADRDPPYFVMELVPGGSLQEFLSGHGAPLGEVVACIGIVMCDALAAAHAAGIVHRDLKPANVMIADDGRLVLSDFGVAHLAEGDSLVTADGAVLGTPAFMAPEQAMGTRPDQRSDLYSLGALLYNLATGARPFQGPIPKVMADIISGAFVPPLQKNPRMGGDLARAIERLMARDPELRFQSASEGREALQAIVSAAGLGDAEVELAAYFQSPGEFNAERQPVIVEATLQAARAAAESRAYPRALALADRVLSLEPDHPDAITLVDRIGDSGRNGWRRWVRLSAAVAMLLAICAAALLISGHDAAQSDGQLGAHLAEPDVANLGASDAGSIDAREAVTAGVAPPLPAAASVTPNPNPNPTRARRRRPDAGEPAPPAGATPGSENRVDAAPTPEPPDAAPLVVRGTLLLRVDVWCNLAIDGTAAGRAVGTSRRELPAGRHDLECTQGAGRPNWSGHATIRPGEVTEVTARLLPAVRVTVQVRGEGVRLDGLFVPSGGSAQVRPGRVAVDLLRNGQIYLRQHIDIPAADCTVKDSPELDCYR